MKAVIVGDLEVTRLTCSALSARGVEVVHLLHPSDRELREQLTGDVDAVAVLLRGDVAALRYALLIEHLRPGVRLVVTLFDRTLSDQLLRVVPNCQITSPADVSAPSIIAACLSDDVLAVYRTGERLWRITDGPDGVQALPHKPAHNRARIVLRHVAGQLRPYDDTSRILLLGLAGLVAVLLTDWILSSLIVHHSLIASFYAATRVVATVGPGEADLDKHNWYLAVASGLMLVTIVLTAIFTAGVVNRILSARSAGIFGRRTVPRRDHVVVVGLGQVGLRVADKLLNTLHVPVVVIERDPSAPNLERAKAAGIPVLIGRADERAMLSRVGLPHARALAAMGSNDLDNVEVAINALAVAPDLRVVMRAGEDEVIAETRSLFRIGQVRDVSALTAGATALALLGSAPLAVYARGGEIAAFDGAGESHIALAGRCDCT